MKKVGTVYRDKLVNRIKDGIENSSNVFVISYSQLSGLKTSEFRKTLKQAGAEVFVSKNSLAQITLKGLEQQELADQISGQTAFILSNSDAVDISKIIVKFIDECDNASVQGGLLDGEYLDKGKVKALSALPPRQILLTMLLGTIQSPLTRLAGALNAKTSDLLSILKQLSEKKGGN
ncbi:MAG: 50S ribosomal protein L10 [Candidatus Omnitrophica bacterium]|nr:50S ribosomal protein L10 [Candidatus Omnitrophota bacterium]